MNTQAELKSSKEIIVYLSSQFPNCFTIEGEAKPLKIGIFQDVAERLTNDPCFSKTRLRMALRLYTASWRYLYSIKDGVNRVDLDGNVCGVVTSEQVTHAQAQLKESKDKVKAKRIAVNKNSTNTSDSPTNSNLPKNKAKHHSNKKGNITTQSVNDIAKKQIRSDKIEQLKVGSSVKIMLGSKPISATISSIEKEHLKVKIPSGMELTITSNHLLI